MAKPLTVQQKAFLELVRMGQSTTAIALLGPNHPTVKWWRRRCAAAVRPWHEDDYAWNLLRDDDDAMKGGKP